MRYRVPVFVGQYIVENKADADQERVCGYESSESAEDFSETHLDESILNSGAFRLRPSIAMLDVE